MSLKQEHSIISLESFRYILISGLGKNPIKNNIVQGNFDTVKLIFYRKISVVL